MSGVQYHAQNRALIFVENADFAFFDRMLQQFHSFSVYISIRAHQLVHYDKIAFQI